MKPRERCSSKNSQSDLSSEGDKEYVDMSGRRLSTIFKFNLEVV